MRFFNQILTFSQGAQSTAGTNLFLEKVLMKTRLNLEAVADPTNLGEEPEQEES